MSRWEKIIILILSAGLLLSIFLWFMGFFIPISQFFATVFSAILPSFLLLKLERKDVFAETLRKEVYGSLFELLQHILENLVSGSVWGELSSPNKLKEIRSHHLFSFVKPNLGKELSDIINEYDDYQRILNGRDIALSEIFRENVVKLCKVDSDIFSSPPLLFYKGKGMIRSLSLWQSIHRQIEPIDFAEEVRKEFGNDIRVEFSSGECEGLDGFQKLYDNVLNGIKNESNFKDEIERRKNLIERLKNYSKEIKSCIKI